MKKVYIAAALRTPIGRFMGSIAGVKPSELAATVMRNILKSTSLPPEAIDEVIIGNILMAGQGQGIARQASIAAGIPVEVPAWGINMICGSGMKTIMTAFSNIRCGQADLILAGGTENMSSAGFVLPGSVRNGIKLGDFNAVDHMVNDGLTDAFSGLHMGITAENVAEKYSVTRAEQDDFSWQSLTKAIDAIDSGRFKNEITPVELISRNTTIVFDTDEHPNRNSSPEKLAGLRPAFKKDGTVTAGNASGINDGAAMVLLASEEAIKKYNLTPMAEIISAGQAGVEPALMGIGPVQAIGAALKRANCQLNSIETMEINEAFAAQSIAVIRELASINKMTYNELHKRINPNGGAIALGHPIGASGARIVVSLVHDMINRNKKSGLASLCIGGGMGTALILKR